MYLNALSTFTIIFAEYIAYLFHKNEERAVITIAEKLAKINIVYVKFVQAISASTGIIDDHAKQRLAQYADNVPYKKEDLDFTFLRELQESGIYLKSTKPINAGLIAVVFKASDKDGKLYAVKVKRRNIYQTMMNSVREIEWIINKLMNYDFFKKINIKQHFERNRHILFDQLDFENEVENIKTFKTNFENIDNIIIPNVYEDYTNKNENIIVMDFIQGMKLNELQPEDKIHYCKAVAKFGLKSMFFDGVYHGDMHQGNIFFILDEKEKKEKEEKKEEEEEKEEENKEEKEEKENKEEKEEKEKKEDLNKYKLGIIDFGIIGKLTREDQNKFYEFLQCLYDERFDDTATYVFENIIVPQEKKEKITEETKKEILEAISKIMENSMREKFTSTKDIYDINCILSQYELEMDAFFSDAQLALIVNNTLCNNLASDSEATNFIDIYGKEFMNL
jgi:predicted unusual protein kinase regulating ubiquinone biosynthesis (AarF/ABC1/UbiB family)